MASWEGLPSVVASSLAAASSLAEAKATLTTDLYEYGRLAGEPLVATPRPLVTAPRPVLVTEVEPDLPSLLQVFLLLVLLSSQSAIL